MKLRVGVVGVGAMGWGHARHLRDLAGCDLVAVADLWLSDAAAQRPGVAISWQNRPPIH